MALPQQKKRPYTYGDYLTWPDDERWEIIEGVPYDMTPAPAPRHQELLGELHVQIHPQLKGKLCRVYLAPFDVRLPEGEQDEALDRTVVQPDLTVFCDRNKLDRRGLRGAPDFVVEIISPSSVSHDQIRKAALYEKHGVKEYWVLHPTDRLVYVRVLKKDGRYELTVREAKGQLQVTAVPDLAVDLEELFAED